YNDQGPYVYVLQSNQNVAIRQILLGKEVDRNVIVLEGLDPEDIFITKGHLRLSSKSKVHIVNSESP
ncbi:MAG TPA: hypothetical protein VN457_00465, partial [Chlamydiales bacterium]|nr:hypothetical protein [Chlamydiales bacterium]